MKIPFSFVSLAAIVLLLINTNTAFAGENTRTFNFKNFKSIEISSGMHLVVTQSDSYSIEAKGNSDDLDDLDVDRSGDVLKIRFKSHGFFSFTHHHKVVFKITMPSLTGLDLSGGAKGNITMDISGGHFSGGLSGGSYLEGELKCGRTNFDLSGGSRVKLSGIGGNVKLEGSGGSKFYLRDFSASNANVDLSGGGQAHININGELNADLSGGSHIYYYGKVELGDTDFSGGSGISKGR